MENPHKTPANASVAVEVFKTVYNDAFAPGAKEIGKAGETIGRAVNLALSPLEGLVWSFEQIKSFVGETVSEKLKERKVKIEDIQSPDADIAVPAIEAMRYSKLKDEFATLLASSMDKNLSEQLHPSFVEILKEITPDEAKIIRTLISPLVGVPFVQRRIHVGDKGFHDLPGYVSKLGDDANIEKTSLFATYVDNLVRLRIISIPSDIFVNDEAAYQELEKSAIATEPEKREFPKIKPVRGVLFLTSYGAQFRRACLT